MNSLSLSSADLEPDLRRLARGFEGEILTDAFSRGRYATDASIYQITPLAVLVPKTEADLVAAVETARALCVPLLPRGGGTSQSGQTVGEALVVDLSKHLREVISVDPDARRCEVQPGIVLDVLNGALARHGLWYPIDVSTSSRATIGGMAGNNSCGTRSIHYGIMRDRVEAIDAILADGTEALFGPVGPDPDEPNGSGDAADLTRDLLRLGQREAAHIAGAFPKVARRVGGYNIDALVPADGHVPINLATLLVGSEGTLALSRRLTLSLAPLPVNKALGVCHFSTFRAAMEAAQHIVTLGPVAVELVDRTMIELSRDIPMFADTVDRFVRGEPDALLLTEFAEDDQEENLRRLDRLEELMGDLGHPGSVVRATQPDFQKAIWEVRKSGLNIMMSMKSEGKPVSFIEDCAVPLEHLADYTERLTAVFAKHGTRATWYAHASVGCLHVRPVLNLKLAKDAAAMRAIAEEAFEMVREYKGAHSGEHGDGLVRSEFHLPAYGAKTVGLFEEIKDRFDPDARLNPGKIVRAARMDDRRLFRYGPDYQVPEMDAALDWSGYTGAGGGFQGAVEMCNNNGACRKFDAGVMCPSYRVTRNERDLTRGRANSLRLAISGQLGPEALGSDAMLETMKLCVACKGCKRECPTGVDMARMKIEVLNAAIKRRGLALGDRLVAYLPRYAPLAAKLPRLANAPRWMPGVARVLERATGLTAKRAMPRWRRDVFDETGVLGDPQGPEVALLADCFNRYFEPDVLRDGVTVLTAGGHRIHLLAPPDGGRPLCCGRTFLSMGLVDEARAEAGRLLAAAEPFAKRGVPIVGLEPSCISLLRDELPPMRLGAAAQSVAELALLLEEVLVRERAAGRPSLPLRATPKTLLLHGHCHQKALGALGSVETVLGWIPDLQASTVQSSCCGMAGAFGYGARTHEVSLAMGELSLLPAVRAAPDDAVIAADGFSCRHQIADGAGRPARHVASVLAEALENGNVNEVRHGA